MCDNNNIFRKRKVTMFTYLVAIGVFQAVYAQPGGLGLFRQQLKRNETNGVQCLQSVSCMPAPWCRRTVDKNGCTKCRCSMGGFPNALAGRGGNQGNSTRQSPFSGMSSMLSSGMSGFPGFPSFNGQSSIMNPMAAMFNQMGGVGGGSGMGFSSLTGPTGIGTGPLPNSNQPVPTPKKTCDPAPYTCSLPPPWCQRIINSDGCVLCYCGEELQKYLKGVQTGNNEQSTMLPVQKNTVTKSTLQRTSPITTTPVPTQPTTTSCLSNFFCTTTCDNGYMTDVNGCPLCQCVQPGSSGIVTTNSPVVHVRTTVSSVVTSRPPGGGTIMCPGIFDCTLMCMNGYHIDDQGCPVCKCLDSSQT